MNETNHEDKSSDIRINKYLVSCGCESRRKADKLIAEGLVEINGRRAGAGARVQAGDFVKVDGKQVKPKVEVTLLLNKPRGIVCSRESQGARNTVYDLLPPKYRHVNYVGRLDADSEGLLLLTSNGKFNDRITQPKSHVEKEYWVTLNQPYDNAALLQLLKGLHLPEGQAKVKYVARLSPRRACVVLEQGLKRQIRQMFACMGLRVRKLVRVRIGSLWGGDLLPGHFAVTTAEQMKLALTNPKRRKGLVGAAQAFPASDKVTSDQWDGKLDMQATREALLDEVDYKFNPDDFETEDEAVNSAYEARRGTKDKFPNHRSMTQGKARPFRNQRRKKRPLHKKSYRNNDSDRSERPRKGFSRRSGSFNEESGRNGTGHMRKFNGDRRTNGSFRSSRRPDKQGWRKRF